MPGRRSPGPPATARRVWPARGEGVAPGDARVGGELVQLKRAFDDKAVPGRAHAAARAEARSATEAADADRAAVLARWPMPDRRRPGRAHRAPPRHPGAYHRPQLRHALVAAELYRVGLLYHSGSRSRCWRSGWNRISAGARSTASTGSWSRPTRPWKRACWTHPGTVRGPRQAEGIRGDADPDRKDVLARTDGRGHRARDEHAARLRQGSLEAVRGEPGRHRPPGCRGRTCCSRCWRGEPGRGAARSPVHRRARTGRPICAKDGALGRSIAGQGRAVRHRADLRDRRQPEELQPAGPQQGRPTSTCTTASRARCASAAPPAQARR